MSNEEHVEGASVSHSTKFEVIYALRGLADLLHSAPRLTYTTINLYNLLANSVAFILEARTQFFHFGPELRPCGAPSFSI